MTQEEFESIEIQILATQSKLEKFLPSDETPGSVTSELIGDLRKQLADLQTRYWAGRESKSMGLKPMTRGLPDIDAQIAYMRKVTQDLPSGWAEYMPDAIYQSLISAKMLNDVKVFITDTEAVIKEIGRPYDLEACSRFIQKLRDRIGKPKKEVHKELIRMYDAITQNLFFAEWVAKCTADLLRHDPGNQPAEDFEAEEKLVDDNTIAGMAIRIIADEGKFIAVHKEVSEQYPEGELVTGNGETEVDAVRSLFNVLQQRKQAELFPKGGHQI